MQILEDTSSYNGWLSALVENIARSEQLRFVKSFSREKNEAPLLSAGERINKT